MTYVGVQITRFVIKSAVLASAMLLIHDWPKSIKEDKMNYNRGGTISKEGEKFSQRNSLW